MRDACVLGAWSYAVEQTLEYARISIGASWLVARNPTTLVLFRFAMAQIPDEPIVAQCLSLVLESLFWCDSNLPLRACIEALGRDAVCTFVKRSPVHSLKATWDTATSPIPVQMKCAIHHTSVEAFRAVRCLARPNTTERLLQLRMMIHGLYVASSYVMARRLVEHDMVAFLARDVWGTDADIDKLIVGIVQRLNETFFTDSQKFQVEQWHLRGKLLEQLFVRPELFDRATTSSTLKTRLSNRTVAPGRFGECAQRP